LEWQIIENVLKMQMVLGMFWMEISAPHVSTWQLMDSLKHKYRNIFVTLNILHILKCFEGWFFHKSYPEKFNPVLFIYSFFSWAALLVPSNYVDYNFIFSRFGLECTFHNINFFIQHAEWNKFDQYHKFDQCPYSKPSDSRTLANL